MTAAEETPSAVAVAAGTGPPVELCPDGGRVALDVAAPPAARNYSCTNDYKKLHFSVYLFYQNLSDPAHCFYLL